MLLPRAKRTTKELVPAFLFPMAYHNCLFFSLSISLSFFSVVEPQGKQFKWHTHSFLTKIRFSFCSLDKGILKESFMSCHHFSGWIKSVLTWQPFPSETWQPIHSKTQFLFFSIFSPVVSKNRYLLLNDNVIPEKQVNFPSFLLSIQPYLLF